MAQETKGSVMSHFVKGCNMSSPITQMVLQGPTMRPPVTLESAPQMRIPDYEGKKSPSALTVQMFKEAGHEIVKLEKWIPRTNIRQDVWGADFLVKQGGVLLAIQATDETNHSHRVTKCLCNRTVPNWLNTGVLFFIYSWGVKGGRGEKHWKLRITQLIMVGDEVRAL